MHLLSTSPILLLHLMLLVVHGAEGALERKCHCKNGILAFTRIDAEHVDISDGVSTKFNTSGMGFLGDIQHGEVFGYCRVRFEDGARALRIRVSSNSQSINSLSLHLDTPDAPPFATVDIGWTYSLEQFAIVDIFLEYIPKDTHDLYMTLTNDDDSDKSTVHVDWFTFLNTAQIAQASVA